MPLITRAGKGFPLTNAEVDGNFLFLATGGRSTTTTLGASIVLALGDSNKFFNNRSVFDYSATIQPQSTVAWEADVEIHFIPTSSGEITIVASAGVLLNGVDGASLVLKTPGQAATLKRIATNEWWLIGAVGDPPSSGSALSDANPLMNGAADEGVGTEASRYDHVHPVDTSREPAIAAGTTAQFLRGDKSWQKLHPEVIAAPLAGYVAGTDTVLSTDDSILDAFGKVQAQINARQKTISIGTTAPSSPSVNDLWIDTN